MIKTLITLGVAAWLLEPPLGQRATGRASLTALDYVEIQQLYARACHGLDSGADEGMMFAGAFTSDGALVSVAGTTQGHAQLAELATRGKTGAISPRHFVTNIHVEAAAGGATGLAHVLYVRIGDAGQASDVTGAAIYRHIFVKRPDGWRIKKWTAIPATAALGDVPRQ